jgi:hypothetical protein
MTYGISPVGITKPDSGKQLLVARRLNPLGLPRRLSPIDYTATRDCQQLRRIPPT